MRELEEKKRHKLHFEFSQEFLGVQRSPKALRAQERTQLSLNHQRYAHFPKWTQITSPGLSF